MLPSSSPTYSVASVSRTTYANFYIITVMQADIRGQVGEITLMKEMTSTAMAMADEEAEAEKTAEASAAAPAVSNTDPPNPELHVSESATAMGAGVATAAGAPVGERPVTPSALSPSALSPSPSSTPGAASPPSGAKHDGTASRKKKVPKTPEQKKKELEADEERRKKMEARITRLTDKLIERLRPYVDAKKPGDPTDEETIAFEQRMKREADDLKLESFGVELLHTIGTIYMMKGTSFLKSKKFLGM
jgi:hypothetical protein